MQNTAVAQLTSANKDMALGNITIAEDIKVMKASIASLENENARAKVHRLFQSASARIDQEK